MQYISSIGLKRKLLPMAQDILFIGTGITSALSAAFLQKSIPGAKITLWDKARGVGGRMSRSISPKDSECIADLGAQYITTNAEKLTKNEDVYGPLIRDKVIEDMTAGVLGMKKFDEDVRHYVAPQGMNSVVKYFLRDIQKENFKFQSRVIAIEDEGRKFVVKGENETCTADVVVSTIPVPQFLQLSGSVKNYVGKYENHLEKVSYSSRFVLVLFFDKCVTFPETNWACQYLDHDVFRYVSLDNMKRNRPDEPVAAIFHTSVKFGLEYLESTLPEMEKVLLKHAKEIFPEWPEPSATRCHKWRFSQVVNEFEGKPGCLVLNQNPTLILGGDAFSDSNFDGCIYSARKIAEAVHEAVNLVRSPSE